MLLYPFLRSACKDLLAKTLSSTNSIHLSSTSFSRLPAGFPSQQHSTSIIAWYLIDCMCQCSRKIPCNSTYYLKWGQKILKDCSQYFHLSSWAMAPPYATAKERGHLSALSGTCKSCDLSQATFVSTISTTPNQVSAKDL